MSESATQPKIYRSRVSLIPPSGEIGNDWLRRRLTEAVVGLYRWSQKAEETGRLFLIKQTVLETNEIEVGLVRTEDPAFVVGLEMFYAGAYRELDQDSILELFKAS